MLRIDATRFQPSSSVSLTSQLGGAATMGEKNRKKETEGQEGHVGQNRT